ncbi:hypothetical protein PHYSODRAFT_475144 [Phytophthora sojae]|uniref:Uncharacterized protein n=1 Tax=Phytophthora sojae (strain P6497) TaxID=1094619 RepID=G4YJR7_PHYSP|nr:hypothetical protein PHYSODRAFT_475144 [Phytophthora sojae]EGZ26624.1 hypothetical protein PHYSODRAFT_475144 [Phytophthora sojae]|eukprot:XP_009513899.1 hypothetical protein PHYSODRAFT_475144 [Phytophthora sojae]
MPLLAPSPPLQVAASSFFRLECDHAQLFHAEYKRSNRTKGLKILRCFPHCCPEHIDRSYCGSSLSVSVRLAERPAGSAPPEPPPSEVLSVFARFEAVSDGVQTETNLDRQWIAGVLDRPSAMVASIRAPDTSSSTSSAEQVRPLVFHLNSKAFSRWYYDWESGANKAQRLMKHVLKAYVVERVAVDMDDNFTTISSREAFTQLYRVLHVVTSPELDSEVVHPLEDKLFWEHANAKSVAVSKNLALLFAFLRWAPLGFYAPFVDELTLLRVASQAALWLYSRETRRWLRTFFRQYAACVLNKNDLRACFLQFLHELEEHLNTEVFAATTLKSLDNVAEEVIAAVYSCDYFHDRRPFVRQILGGQGFAGWNMFVAQMRDSFIGSTSLPQGLYVPESNAIFSSVYPPHNAIERSWNGEWFLNLEDSRWEIGDKSASAGKTGQDVSLRVRSMRGVAGRFDCMHVILDGKDRVFRLFPNGIASSAGKGSCGDYVGKMRVDKPGRLLVFLETFVWALEEVDQSYHIRARIEHLDDGRLSIDGDILATTGSFTAEEMPYVAEMSLRTKRKSVGKANARRSHASGASTDGIVAAWRGHSKFHLSYRKVV